MTALHLQRALFLLALSACTTYQPHPVSATANADTLTTRSIDSPVVRQLIAKEHPDAAASWPPPRWTPEMLTLAAIALHPDLDVARAGWASARAALRTAAERPNPTVSIGVEHKATGGAADPWVTTLSLDVPIETAGKRGVRVSQAKALSAAAAADVDQAMWTVRTRTANAAVDLATSEQLAGIRRDEVKLREEIVAMVERRLAVGEAAQPEVTRARAEDRTSRMLLREEEGRAAEREATLATSIGIRPVALPPIDFSPLMTAPPVIADADRLRTFALTSRPDVLAALARYDAAEQALRLEVHKQYPDVHLGPGLGWDQGAFKWALSAAAEIPIFNQHRGAIGEAEAQRSVAAAQLLALQAHILGELDGAMAAEHGARSRLDETELVLASRQSLVTSARKQFDAGEIDRLALRVQEIEIALAGIDRWNAWFDLQRARIAVEAAVEQTMGSAQ